MAQLHWGLLLLLLLTTLRGRCFCGWLRCIGHPPAILLSYPEGVGGLCLPRLTGCSCCRCLHIRLGQAGRMPLAVGLTRKTSASVRLPGWAAASWEALCSSLCNASLISTHTAHTSVLRACTGLTACGDTACTSAPAWTRAAHLGRGVELEGVYG